MGIGFGCEVVTEFLDCMFPLVSVSWLSDGDKVLPVVLPFGVIDYVGEIWLGQTDYAIVPKLSNCKILNDLTLW